LSLGVDSEILGLNDPVEKVIFFRLACAKGQLVTIAPKTPVLTRWVIDQRQDPRIIWTRWAAISWAAR
jgi:hypothetical protein